MRSLRAGLVLTGALMVLLLAGCEADELTQVVLVVQSDLMVPGEVDGMDVAAIEGPYAPPVNPFFGGAAPALGPFPRSVGFRSGGTTRSFSAVIRLFRGAPSLPTPTLVISRTVTDVRFVDDQTMMLLFPLNRMCACQGTTCPGPGNPACDNLDAPELQPFDPAIAPPSTMMGAGGGTIGGQPRPQRPDGSAP
jgi:hypothetical protein